MIRVAIVEDEEKAAAHLESLLLRYSRENDCAIDVSKFSNAVSFLANYSAVFDLIFMDIEMPHLNGLDAAAKLRETDKTTLLIFATNMGHMAVRGYEVEAFDFVVKPVQYDALRLKLKRAFAKLAQMRGNDISFTSEGARIRLPSAEVKYIEVRDHQLIYHTAEGDYQVYGTMSALKEQLEPMGFFLCNNCYLVNLKHVRKVQNFTVTVGGDELQISRPRKKAFLEALNNYIGG